MTTLQASPADRRRRPALLLSGAVRVLWWLGLAALLAPALVTLFQVVWKDGGFTLTHLQRAFGDLGRLAVLLGNSLGVMAGTLLVSLGLGTPIGYLCFRTNVPGRRLYLMGALWAATLPLYVTVAAWMGVFGSAFWLTLDAPWKLIVGASWLQGITYVPLVAILSGVALATASASLEEAALVDGNRWQVFRGVLLPAAAWALGASALAVGVLCFADITVTDLLTVRTFPEETFTQFIFQGDVGGGAATALPVILVLAALFYGLWRWLRHHEPADADRFAPVWRMPAGGKAIGAGVLLVGAAMAGIPLLALAVAVRSPHQLVSGIEAAEREVMFSSLVTPLAVLTTLAMALPWAWALVHGRWRAFHATALVILLAMPAPVVGMGLIEIFNQPGWWGAVYDSPAIVVMAHTVRALPLCTLALIPAITRLPPDQLAAASLEGATWLQTLRHLVIPQSWRQLGVAGCLAMVLSLGEIGASFLVMPPGSTTVTVRFFSLIHYGLYPNAASLCLMVIGVLGIPAALLAWLLGRQLTRRFM